MVVAVSPVRGIMVLARSTPEGIVRHFISGYFEIIDSRHKASRRLPPVPRSWVPRIMVDGLGGALKPIEGIITSAKTKQILTNNAIFLVLIKASYHVNLIKLKS